GDVDGVVEPFAGVGGPDEVSAAGVGGGADVDAVVAKLSAVICGGGVVVGDAFPPVVVLLKLDRARDALGLPLERSRRGGHQHSSLEKIDMTGSLHGHWHPWSNVPGLRGHYTGS